MRKTERERYKQMLRNTRARLRDEIRESINTVREEVHVPGEDSKEPSEGLDKELALEKNQEQIVNAVNEALQRIEDRTFGRCTDCGGVIPGERLAAVPYSPYCIECEKDREVAEATER